MLLVGSVALLVEGSSGLDGFVTWAFVLLFVGALGYALYVWRKRQEALEAYLAAQGFVAKGSKLPATLVPPAISWMPEYEIRNCYTGVRGGFEVALFQTQMRQGEAMTVRTLVGVRRPPCMVKMNQFVSGIVQIDQTSTAGWILASWKGGSRRVPLIEAVLKALTDAHPEEAT